MDSKMSFRLTWIPIFFCLPYFWLNVSMYPEGRVIGHADTGFTTLSESRMSNVRKTNERWIGKYLEGNGRDLLKTLSRCMPGGTEGNHENLSHYIRYHDRVSYRVLNTGLYRCTKGLGTRFCRFPSARKCWDRFQVSTYNFELLEQLPWLHSSELNNFTVKASKLSFVLYWVFIVQAYQTSQYVVPRSGIFLGKWRSSFAGGSDGKMNVHSACALNTRYNSPLIQMNKILRALSQASTSNHSNVSFSHYPCQND
jgi:hypothetical protein